MPLAGGLGALGTGVSVPWSGQMAYRSSALYYYISAQLGGSGDIHCALYVKVTAYYSDGSHISRKKLVAEGHASGSYNICSAQSS